MTGRCDLCGAYARWVPWHYLGLAVGVLFAIVGVIAAVSVFSTQQLAYEELKATRAACVVGNDRDCRVYEIEWGSK